MSRAPGSGFDHAFAGRPPPLLTGDHGTQVRECVWVSSRACEASITSEKREKIADAAAAAAAGNIEGCQSGEIHNCATYVP